MPYADILFLHGNSIDFAKTVLLTLASHHGDMGK